MSHQNFREYLKSKGLTTEETISTMVLVQQFEEFVELKGDIIPTKEHMKAFAEILISKGENTQFNYYALLRYGCFITNNEICNAVSEFLGVEDALDNLYRQAETILETERMPDRV